MIAYALDEVAMYYLHNDTHVSFVFSEKPNKY